MFGINEKKTQQAIIQQIINVLGYSNVQLVDKQGKKHNIFDLKEDLEYDLFIDSMKEALSSFYEVVENGSLTVPESLKIWVLGFESKKKFSTSIIKEFDDGDIKGMPGEVFSTFNYMMKGVSEGKIKKQLFKYVTGVGKVPFENWVSKYLGYNVDARTKAQVHYIYDIMTTRKKAQNERVVLKYVGGEKEKYLINGSPHDFNLCATGFSIIYPTTGKMVTHEYNGTDVSVPEYDKGTEKAIIKNWAHRRKQTPPSTIYTYEHAKGYVWDNTGGQTYGILASYKNPRVKSHQKITIDQMNATEKTNKVFGTDKYSSYSMGNPLNDLSGDCLVGFKKTYDDFEGYPTDKVSSNLDWFAFHPQWILELHDEPYKFTMREYEELYFAWRDPDHWDAITMLPGLNKKPDGTISGQCDIPLANADKWSDALNKTDKVEDLNEIIKQEDLPGIIIIPSTGEVVGRPGVSIEDALEDLNNNFPSYGYNPSVLGVNVYAGRYSDVGSFVDELWGGDFFDVVKKIWTSPMDCIVSVHTIPFAPATSGSDVITAGNYKSKVSMDRVTNQFVNNQIGFFDVQPIYAGTEWEFMDYQYTKVSLYVPYCGSVDLPVNLVMGTAVSVTFTVDVMTGVCNAGIYADGTLIAVLDGDCSLRYPLSGANYSSMNVQPSTFASPFSTADTFFKIRQAEGIGDVGGVVQGSLHGSTSGIYNNQCVMIISRPIGYGSRGNDVNDTYDCLLRGTLSEFSGYVRVSKFYQPSGDLGLATKEELSEIESILKSGVYL